jgi:hypothetical protein
MTNLSPAAQAVSDAYFRYALGKEPSFEVDRKALAVALRAAAEQLHHDPGQSHQVGGVIASRLQLLAIAAELESHNE